MIYADETFYKESYLLGRKPVISAGFSFYARQASLVIDQYTFGRLKDVAEDAIPEAVRMCCCELAESLFMEDKSQLQANGKTSEKIGTYSVTYGDASASAQAVHGRQKQAVYRWLENTGLLYQGV